MCGVTRGQLWRGLTFAVVLIGASFAGGMTYLAEAGTPLLPTALPLVAAVFVVGGVAGFSWWRSIHRRRVADDQQTTDRLPSTWMVVLVAVAPAVGLAIAKLASASGTGVANAVVTLAASYLLTFMLALLVGLNAHRRETSG